MINKTPIYEHSGKVSFTDVGLDKWAVGDFIPANARELNSAIQENIATAKQEGRKSIAVEFARREYVTSANDAMDLIKAMGTEGAIETFKNITFPEIIRKANITHSKPLKDGVLYSHLDKFVYSFHALVIYHGPTPDHKKGTEYDFADVVSAMRHNDSQLFNADVTYIQLPEDQVDHRESIHTSKAMIVVRTKTPGMFLLLVIEQDADGNPTSIRPALGFNIAEN